MKRRRAAHETRTTPDVDDLEGLFDVLRQNLARADAMVCATEHQLERFSWVVGNASDETEDDDRGRRLDHLAHLLGATKESVRAAVYAGVDLAAKLARRSRDV